jgi:hypothetical protein
MAIAGGDMIRSVFRMALVVATMFAPACAQREAGTPAAAPPADDRESIYRAFLDTWTEHGKRPVNVASSAEAPTAQQMKELEECASGMDAGGRELLPPETVVDLAAAMRGLPYAHLVHKAEWKPADPADLIREGQPVESAVDTGFANGLLTLSAIAFDRGHTTAAFSYSFVCGGLCGNGATVVFHRDGARWRQAKAQCGDWIS